MATVNIPSTAGIGQGAAQVFNLQPLVQLYAKQQQVKQQRAAADAAAVAEMSKSLESGKKGIRVEDIPEYNEKYNQWREIYLKNPSLYGNPAANIEAYRQAERLKQEMGMIATASNEFKGATDQVLKTWSSNPYRLKGDAMTEAAAMFRMPVSQVIAKTGGIPNVIDMLKFRPEEVNVKGNVEAIQKLTDLGGGYEMTQKRVTWKDDPTIGTGNEKTWQDKVYRPEALANNTQLVYQTNPKLEQFYQNKFADTQPDALGSMQQRLDDRLGKQSFKISDPLTMAQADVILNYGNIPGQDKAKIKVSEEWKQQREDERFQKQMAKEREMAIFKERLRAARPDKADSKSDAVIRKLDDNKLALFYRAAMSSMPETAEGLPTVQVRGRDGNPKQYTDLSGLLGNIKIAGQFGDKSEKYIRRVLKDPGGDGVVVVLNGKDDLLQVLGRSAKKEADQAWGGFPLFLTNDEVSRVVRAARTQNNLKEDELQALEELYGPDAVPAKSKLLPNIKPSDIFGSKQ